MRVRVIVALVAGNGAYRTSAWRRQNAVSNANDLAAELAGLGFAVSKATDADLRAMERAGSRLNMIILDACRNNPFRAARGGARVREEPRAAMMDRGGEERR